MPFQFEVEVEIIYNMLFCFPQLSLKLIHRWMTKEPSPSHKSESRITLWSKIILISLFGSLKFYKDDAGLCEVDCKFTEEFYHANWKHYWRVNVESYIGPFMQQYCVEIVLKKGSWENYKCHLEWQTQSIVCLWTSLWLSVILSWKLLRYFQYFWNMILINFKVRTLDGALSSLSSLFYSFDTYNGDWKWMK